MKDFFRNSRQILHGNNTLLYLYMKKENNSDINADFYILSH